MALKWNGVSITFGFHFVCFWTEQNGNFFVCYCNNAKFHNWNLESLLYKQLYDQELYLSFRAISLIQARVMSCSRGHVQPWLHSDIKFCFNHKTISISVVKANLVIILWGQGYIWYITLWFPLIWGAKSIVIVIPWPQGICLIYTPKG